MADQSGISTRSASPRFSHPSRLTTAAGVAALLTGNAAVPQGANTVTVISGGNIGLDKLKTLLYAPQYHCSARRIGSAGGENPMVKTLVQPGTDDLVRLKMTYDEYLERFDEDLRVEWVDGEAIVYMPPNEPHQDLVAFLVSLLRLYTSLRNLGKVLAAPFELRLPTGSSREPDILFLSREHFERRSEERWQEPLPDPDDLMMDIAPDDYLRKMLAAHERRRRFDQD